VIEDLQPGEPPEVLARVIARVAPGWLQRCVVDTAVQQLGACPDDLRAIAAEMAERETPDLVRRIGELLATDVDLQRAGPLAVLRSAVTHPTEVLGAAGVPPVERDEFEQRSFPADVYRLSPATWSDVDPALQDPGITWGAWKAATVLFRRRQEGLR
jgi:hypothetical protein